MKIDFHLYPPSAEEGEGGSFDHVPLTSIPFDKLRAMSLV
jgi:hypothetical protein